MEQRIYEVEGVIENIKFPFHLFKKLPPIVFLRIRSGDIMEFVATEQMIDNLPLSIDVGMYTQAQYRKTETGYQPSPSLKLLKTGADAL